LPETNVVHLCLGDSFHASPWETFGVNGILTDLEFDGERSVVPLVMKVMGNETLMFHSLSNWTIGHRIISIICHDIIL
jgi:hypothetical protein